MEQLITKMYCRNCKCNQQILRGIAIPIQGKKQLLIKSLCSKCKKRMSKPISHDYRYKDKGKGGKGIINTALKKLPIGEKHMKLPRNHPSEYVPGGSFNRTGKYSYCGPFTKVEKRIQEGYVGVNALDAACREHDIAYLKYSDTVNRNSADDELAKVATTIASDPNVICPFDGCVYERDDARLVSAIMSGKSYFHM